MGRRIRTIKPEVLDSESMAMLSDAAWRLFVSMWVLADDCGNLGGNDSWLASNVFWNRNASPVAELIIELEAAEHVSTYWHSGKRFIHIEKFTVHQRIDKPSGPKVIEPSKADGLKVPAPDSTKPREDSANTQLALAVDRKGVEGSGREDPPEPPKRKPKVKQPKSERPGWTELLASYSNAWKALHSLEGKTPVIEGADVSALARVYDTQGLEETKTLVERFVSDPDAFTARRGHMLRDLPSRVNAYRAKPVSDSRKGVLPPSTSVDAATRALRKF